VHLWRQTEVGITNGRTTAQACKEAEITEQTYYRWRKEYGDLKLDQAKSLKEPERKNAKLKRLVAKLSLEKHILKDVARGNFEALSGGVARSGVSMWSSAPARSLSDFTR
jgi:putative transposase